ncbi:MAG: hypothetical protein GY755_17900 [Chloroflexi bacterium]|nr:hypothetical protein [Chloroflexota bacterium]
MIAIKKWNNNNQIKAQNYRNDDLVEFLITAECDIIKHIQFDHIINVLIIKNKEDNKSNAEMIIINDVLFDSENIVICCIINDFESIDKFTKKLPTEIGDKIMKMKMRMNCINQTLHQQKKFQFTIIHSFKSNL